MLPVVLYFILFLSSVKADFKLSDSKLLLPYYSLNPVNYTIKGSSGACYEWYSGTPEVATVIPIDDLGGKCSNKASITAVWQSPHRAVATIYARVSATGHIVKCDVIVGDISRIEISTTTQELYLHNTPVSLVVNAFDEYGNTFSSLEGVPFEWHIFGDTYDGAGDGHSVLRFLTWKESEYDTPSSVQFLESKGMQGYMQLISGLRTGSAVVSVSLQESVYSHVQPGQVRLLVMANAQLSPALAYLMPQARLKFRVHVVQQGNEQEVIMPSTQYHLQVNNTDLATLDSDDGCTLTAQQYGQTQVILLDRNVEEALDNLDEILHSKAPETDLLRLPKRRRPTSLIHIVEPAYLGFTLTPKYTVEEINICKHASLVHSIMTGTQTGKPDSPISTRNWIMEVGKLYVISTDIYDRNNHRLYSSGNLRLDLTFPENHFEVIYASMNSTYALVRPLLPGTVAWKAKLQGLVDRDGKFVSTNIAVTGTQDITIYPPVKINPSELIFPWPVDFEAPNGTSGSGGYKLKASGGCGQYRWIALPTSISPCSNFRDCSNSGLLQTSSVVSVNQDGEAQALGFGEAIIVASSYSNPELCGYATVQVRAPTQLKFTPGRAEVLVGNLPSLSGVELLDSLTTNPSDNASYSMQTSQFKWNTDWSFRPAASEEDSQDSLKILPIGLAVLDAEGRSMSDCRHLSITLRLLDSSIIRILPALYPPRHLRATEQSNSTVTECLCFHVIGKQVGFTEIEASHLPQSHSDGNIHPLTARTTIGAYKSIAFVNPKSTATSFAIGSTRDFLLTQGPQPWILLPSEHYIHIRPKMTDQTKTQPSIIHEPHFLRSSHFAYDDEDLTNSKLAVQDPDSKLVKSRLVSFSLRCESTGTFVFSVEMGNKPTASNPIPMVLSTEFSLLCDVAHSLRLISHFPLPTLPAGMPACPYQNTSSLHWSHDKLMLPNTIPSFIILIFVGSNGQELEAVDSISPVIDLLREDPTFSKSNQPNHLVRQSKPQIQFGAFHTTAKRSDMTSKSDYAQPYFTLVPLDLGSSTGMVHIRVDAQSKSSRYLPFATGHRNLQTSINVFLSPTIQVEPSKQMRLFLHPNVESHVSILGGSGFFHLDSLSSTDHPTDDLLVIREQNDEMVGQLDPTDQIPAGHIYEVRPKRVGQTILTATDLCFPALATDSLASGHGREPAKSEVIVNVVGVSSLVLRIRDQIELGSETTADVIAIGTDGQILDAEFARLLKLDIVASGGGGRMPGETDDPLVPSGKTPILGLPLVEMPSNLFWTPDRSNLARFNVKGLNLGSARLQVSLTMQNGIFKESVTIRSNIVEIQVFAPLRLAPCNFNLVLGAEFEVRATGGPRQASLEFFKLPDSKSHLSVSKNKQDSVLIRSMGPVGSATIRARAVGVLTPGNETFDALTDDEQVFVYSETSCTIHVVALSGIRIGCPLATSTEAHSPLTGTTPSDQTTSDPSADRFLIACSPGSGPMCGSAPLWVEGIALTSASSTSSQERLSTSVVNPLGMARTWPPLRFKWRLNPPEPTPYAKLVFWLNGFGVKADETQSSSGLILVGLKPGRVTIELIVEAMDPNFKQIIATTSDGKPVNRLITQMTVVILPRLELAIPPRVHQQILMSPNSQLTLVPLLESRTHSVLNYQVKTLHYSNTSSSFPSWHTLPNTNFVTVSSDGVLRIGDQCSATGLICHSLVQITSHPTDELLQSPNSMDQDTLLTQNLLLEIVIKTPRYLILQSPQIMDLGLDILTEYPGLPIGGPYLMDVSYHDELGRSFDVVSDALLNLRTSPHRSDLFSTQLVRESDSESNNRLIGQTKLAIHVLSPPTANENQDLHPSRTDASLWSVLDLSNSVKDSGLWPTYLSLPYGGSLNVMIPNLFVEGQWACLPDLPMAGMWTSSEPSVIWIDNTNHIILARRQGKATLSYKLTPSKASSSSAMNTSQTKLYESPTYLLSVSVYSLVELAQSNSKDKPQLIPIDTEQRLLAMPYLVLASGTQQTSRSDLSSSSSPSSYLSILRFLAQLPTPKGSDSTCASDDAMTRSNLAVMAPLQCILRLKSHSFTDSTSTMPKLNFVPNWLAQLVLWQYNETLASVLETDSLNLSIDRLITVQLESVVRSSSYYSRSTQWQCVLRSSPNWQHKVDIITLIMEPKTRLTLDLVSRKSRDETVSLAQTDILPLLGFEMLVPPTLRISQGNQLEALKHVYHFQINNPDKLTRQLLVFVPPSTAEAINSKELGSEKLVSRSKDPNLVDLVEPIRPVHSLAEISQALQEYSQSLQSNLALSDLSQSVRSVLMQWHQNAVEQIQALEDVTLTGNDQILKRGLVWIVKIKGILNESANHGVVPLTISFAPTGQRMEIPIHIHFPPKSYLISGASESGSLLNSTFGFTWIHLFALILITLILAVIVHLVVQSNVLISSTTGSTNLRSPLPTPASPKSNDLNRSRQLWSQSLLPGSSPSQYYQKPTGLHQASLRPARLSPTNHLAPDRSPPMGTNSIFSPTAGGDLANEERRWRHALNNSGSGSPSRLRTTFDSI